MSKLLTLIPTSAGLQEVEAEVVTTELLMVILKVVMESQPLLAPPIKDH
ncbi:MAG: hypothetical protein R2772_10365 [Chitinophagales bacterium]